MIRTLALTLALLPSLAAAAAPARLVRSTVGPRGELRGSRFIVDQPRSEFQAGQDHQVVAFFEWDSTVGRHHCEASWRDPSGKVALVAPTDYDTRTPRFGLYWTLALPDSPPLGLWAVEVTVDGQPAGTATFRISSDAPDPAKTGPTRLSARDLYARAAAAVVTVESLTADGQRLSSASGFYVDPRTLVTTFQVLEGASSARVVLPGGQRLTDVTVLLASRRQDWVVLRTPDTTVPTLTLARDTPLAVGDRGVFLGVAEDGGRTLQEVAVVGRRDVPGAGPRLNLTSGASAPALGGPLLDEYGRVGAIMGGTLLPASGVVAGVHLRFGTSVAIEGTTAVPVEAMPDLSKVTTPPFAVSELLARGLVAPPLTGTRRVRYGLIGKGDPAGAIDAADQFTRGEQAVVRIEWTPAQKESVETKFEVFDIDNKGVVASQPSTVKLRAGEPVFSTWKLPTAPLAPGTYRIDLYAGGEASWRTFITIVE